MSGPEELTENADGTISFSPFRDEAGVVQHWREVGSFVWQDVHSQRRLVAVVRNGDVTELSSDDLPPVFVYLPVTSARGAAWNRPMFFATLAVVLILALSWPTSALIRRYFRRPAARPGREGVVYRIAHTAVIIDLIFLGGWCAVLFFGFTHVTVFSSDLDALLRLLQAIGVLGVAGVVFAAGNVYLAWRGRHRSWVEKGASVLIVSACVATIWFAFSQCLLTTSLNY